VSGPGATPDSIHRSARAGYSAAAQTYREGRPDYPPETALWLRGDLALGPGKAVLDLGAGSGKFLPPLIGTGARVRALEPVEAMREALVRDYPQVALVDGVAEAIDLPDKSMDCVVCAQAFHWFATAAAQAEIHRVLAPGGTLGLIWNVRDERLPWVAALSAIIDARESDAPRYRTGQWRQLFPAPGFVEIGQRYADNPHVGAAEQVIVARTLSVSFIAALPPAERAEVERDVRALIAATPELAGQARVTYPYRTGMFAWRKVPVPDGGKVRP